MTHSITTAPEQVQPADIRAALRRIAPVIRSTPVLTVSGDEFGISASITLHLKLEHLQHSGSFKARGAVNALFARRLPPVGVVAASGGNHGAAVAWAAQRIGIPATIFVPTIAAASKVQRLRDYRADVRIGGAVYSEALAASASFAEASGARRVHAFDEPLVMTGAGTLGCELSDAIGHLDSVVVACGGGGLAGGLGSWFGPHGPRLHVVETDHTGTFAAALRAGQPVPIEVSGIAADALGASQLGALGWAALRHAGALSVLVTDREVIEARAWLWDRYRLLIEPAAAAVVAAVTSGRTGFADGETVAVVLCGANTALGELAG